MCIFDCQHVIFIFYTIYLTRVNANFKPLFNKLKNENILKQNTNTMLSGSRFFLQLGIRHNPFAKEERQNNPEVMSGQAYFDQYQEGLHANTIKCFWKAIHNSCLDSPPSSYYLKIF